MGNNTRIEYRIELEYNILEQILIMKNSFNLDGDMYQLCATYAIQKFYRKSVFSGEMF